MVVGESFRLAPAPGAGGTPAATQAIFAVWENEEALEVCESNHELVNWWADPADQVFSVRLEPLSAHGEWHRDVPFPGLAGVHGDDRGGPIAVFTRATVRDGRHHRFEKASGRLYEVLSLADGCLGYAAARTGRHTDHFTFSIWRSRAELTEFAYAHPLHTEILRKSRVESWYGEELFARFRPYRATGTWPGTDHVVEL
jgi:hypothetical protein